MEGGLAGSRVKADMEAWRGTWWLGEADGGPRLPTLKSGEGWGVGEGGGGSGMAGHKAARRGLRAGGHACRCSSLVRDGEE